MGLNKFQKRFLQFIMKAKTCPQDLAVEALDAIYGNADDQEDLEQFIEGINNSIKKFDMEVVSGRSEVTGQESLALIQLCEKTAIQPSKAITKKNSDLFSRLISRIVLSPKKKISETDAINTGSLASLNKGATQAALQDLAQEDWLELEGGNVFLGVRTILELGQFISSFYPNSAKSCVLCRKQVFYGALCRSCGSVTHKHCASKFSRQNGSYSCVSCKTNINVEEDMDVEDDSVLQASSSRSQPSTSATLPTPAKRPRLK